MRRLLATLATASLASATTLNLRLLPSSLYPDAICNDGTQSGYYFKASPSGSHDWVVHMEGGGWCYDKATCAKRSSDQKSSKNWVSTYSAAGIFESTDARLKNANLVYVGYCTSDAYAGAVTSSPVNFAFMGRAVVKAVFDDLMATQGLGNVSGTRVLYGGCSAGARGAMFNADAVGAQLTGALGANLVRYGTLLDSGFYQDIEPYDAALPSLMYITQQATALQGSAPFALPACAEKYPGDDLWKCFYGSYLVPFLSHPFFLHQFLYDSYQLDKNGATGTPKGAQVAYDEAFRNLTHTYAALDFAASAVATGDKAATLPACHKHCNTLTGNTWSTLTTQGVPLEKAVAAWFSKDAGVDDYLEDSCKGYACGPGCP